MALTRAQLLAGNQNQGNVLPGQVQAVSQGLGILIDFDGTISVDASTAEGLVRLNNGGAYNGYVWPSSLGPVGSQLTLGASGALTWEDADGIPWTAPGQLVVGTGPDTQAILNPGATTSVLMADATATNGLQYSNSATSAILTPAGTTTQRPGLPGNVAAIAGQIRFNIDTDLLELYTGAQWVPVGSPVQAGLGINLSGTSPNEVYKLDVPVQTGPPPAGSLPAEAIPGSMYWDDTQGLLFIRYQDPNSTQWVQVIPSGGGSGVTSLASGAGISVSGATGAVTITNTGVLSVAASGPGLTATTSLGGAVTLSNTGVTSVAASGAGITATTGPGGAVTLGNTGVTSLTAGTGITISGSTGAVTITANNSGTVTNVTGTAPIVVASGSTTPSVSLNVGLGNSVNGGFLKANTDVRTGPPAAGPGQLQAIDGTLYWDNTQGLLFIRYNDTNSVQWVQVTPVTPAPSGFSGSFLSQGGQTVTVVNGLIQSVV